MNPISIMVRLADILHRAPMGAGLSHAEMDMILEDVRACVKANELIEAAKKEQKAS